MKRFLPVIMIFLFGLLASLVLWLGISSTSKDSHLSAEDIISECNSRQVTDTEVAICILALTEGVKEENVIHGEPAWELVEEYAELVLEPDQKLTTFSAAECDPEYLKSELYIPDIKDEEGIVKIRWELITDCYNYEEGEAIFSKNPEVRLESNREIYHLIE
jgi:hypothetical protein